MNRIKINYNEIRKKAKEILELEHEISSVIPIDIDLFAEKKGFSIIPTELKGKISKEAFLLVNTKEIVVERDLYFHNNDHRFRFSIAHELGHYYLHKDFYMQFNFKSIEQWKKAYKDLEVDIIDDMEVEANRFASFLLMPDRHLSNIFNEQLELLFPYIEKAKIAGLSKCDYQSYVIDKIATRISYLFNVSQISMCIRLRDNIYIDLIP